MPKVLRILNRFNVGGPTYNAVFLSAYMPQEFETLLIGGIHDESEASSQYIAENHGLKPIIIPEMRRSIGKSDIAAYKKIDAIIKEFKPDIVHTHASKAGALGRLAAINNNVEHIVHTFHGHVFHSYFHPLKTAFYKNLERYFASKSSAIVTISEKQKHEIAIEHKICNPSKVKVIPLGFDLKPFYTNIAQKREEYRKKWAFGSTQIVVTIVGRLVAVKNHKMYIDAVIEANKCNSEIRGLIVGDGDLMQELQQYVTSKGSSFRVDPYAADQLFTFTSWEREVDRVYAASEMVCLTSLNEGTPVSLIEAQAAFKPVISTRVGGVENIVLNNKSGILLDAFNTDLLVEAILQLTDEAIRNEFGKTGYNFAVDYYSYNRLVGSMADLYNELLHRNS